MELIAVVWEFRTSKSQLQRFYRVHNVGFRTAKMRYRYAQLNKPFLLQKQHEYAVLLGNLLTRRTSICFMDEATFNTQAVQRKS